MLLLLNELLYCIHRIGKKLLVLRKKAAVDLWMTGDNYCLSGYPLDQTTYSWIQTKTFFASLNYIQCVEKKPFLFKRKDLPAVFEKSEL